MSQDPISTSFKNKQGREFSVSLDFVKIKQIRDEVGVNLSEGETGMEGLRHLAHDVVKLIDAIYVVVREQCDVYGMSDEDFGRSLDGDSVVAATDAFMAAFSLLQPSALQGPMLKALGRSQGARREAAEEIASLDIDKLVDEQIAAAKAAKTTKLPSSVVVN